MPRHGSLWGRALVGALLTLFTTGCGGSENDPTGPGPDPADPPNARAPTPVLFVLRGVDDDEANRNGNIWLYTGGFLQLTRHAAEDLHPAGSPDGERFAFQSDRDGNWGIYTLRYDGTGLTKITDNGGDDVRPTWSPDGSRIAFASVRDGAKAQIYVIDADGSGSATRLTGLPSGASDPAWSADGSTIAITSLDDTGFRQIYLISVAGTGLIRLTTNSSSNHAPCWSPEGRIGFERDSHIWIMNSDGTNQVAVAQDSEAVLAEPDWSPDGRTIAFERTELEPGAQPQLYQRHLDGTESLIRLAPPGNAYQPAWTH